MAQSTRRSTSLAILRALMRFGPPLIGLIVIGRAIVISIGGDIERWQFALGVLLLLAGFASKLVPER